MAGRNQSSNVIDHFDSLLRGQDDMMNNPLDDVEVLKKPEEMLSYHIEEETLKCPALEDNPIFHRLKMRLRQFYFIKEEYRRNGPDQA